MSTVRGTALQGYRELVAELGVDPDALLRAAGISPEAVGDPDAFIALRAGVEAVEAAAAVTGSLDFGRRLAERQGIEILGPVGVAARTAPTVGRALESIALYLSVYSPAMKVGIDPIPGVPLARFTYTMLLARPPDHRQVMELALGVTLRVFRLLLTEAWAPGTVHFPHASIAPRRNYEAYFGCRVRFEEPFAGFTVRAADLVRPLAADSEVHDVVSRYLRSVVPPDTDDVSEPVRQMIRRMLPTGGLALEPIAARLGMHPRTLQRRLASEGTSFELLTDAVRQQIVDHYLRHTKLPLTQLAAVAGYSEQSALSRSCRRWFGTTPSAYRGARSPALDAPGSASSPVT
ncbi:MAG: AraC family transcriptional regulator [Actinomycetota bacterium]|jgi:AraC-like DNA-binding protein